MTRTSKEIRKAFLDFFQEKNHQIVVSAPMVVKGDPTLMFTNAGMNQFKNIFLVWYIRLPCCSPIPDHIAVPP